MKNTNHSACLSFVYMQPDSLNENLGTSMSSCNAKHLTTKNFRIQFKANKN